MPITGGLQCRAACLPPMPSGQLRKRHEVSKTSPEVWLLGDEARRIDGVDILLWQAGLKAMGL